MLNSLDWDMDLEDQLQKINWMFMTMHVMQREGSQPEI